MNVSRELRKTSKLGKGELGAAKVASSYSTGLPTCYFIAVAKPSWFPGFAAWLLVASSQFVIFFIGHASGGS